ncbi:MAG: hypothetical protein GY835_26890 [bacterium]|nr:hypothetical protein [bacterium]
MLAPGGQRSDVFYCTLHDDIGTILSVWHIWGQDGEFKFTGLADGVYYLAAREQHNDDLWWYYGTGSFENATPIVITGHEAVSGISWSLPGSGGEAGR